MADCLADQLRAQGRTESRFNTTFLPRAIPASREMAGIRVALYGSFSPFWSPSPLRFPSGCPQRCISRSSPAQSPDRPDRNQHQQSAAVPSIVLACWAWRCLSIFRIAAPAPLVGYRAVADDAAHHYHHFPGRDPGGVASIRQAALVGGLPAADRNHHVLPVAMPGILTGSIIGMAQALGSRPRC